MKLLAQRSLPIWRTSAWFSNAVSAADCGIAWSGSTAWKRRHLASP